VAEIQFKFTQRQYAEQQNETKYTEDDICT